MISIKNLALFFFITLIYHQKVLSQSAYVIKINQTTILNKEPKFSRPIYKTLKAGDKVEFLDVVYNNDSEYFKVKDSYSTGYIKSSSVEITDASLKNIITKKRDEFGYFEKKPLNVKQNNIPKSIKDVTDKFTFTGKAIKKFTLLKHEPNSNPRFYTDLQIGNEFNIIGGYKIDNLYREYIQCEYNNYVGWINLKDVELDKKSKIFVDFTEKIESLIANKSGYFTDSLMKNESEKTIKILNLIINSDKLKDSIKIAEEKEKLEKISNVRKKNKPQVVQEISLKYDSLIIKENSLIAFKLDSINSFYASVNNIILIQQGFYQDSLRLVQAQNKEKKDLIAKQKILDERQKLKDIEARKKIEAQRAITQRLTNLEKRFGKDNARRIFDKKAWIGMTESMLVESWGKPRSINKTTTQYGTRKQYVYSSGNYVSIGYDGLVEIIQN